MPPPRRPAAGHPGVRRCPSPGLRSGRSIAAPGRRRVPLDDGLWRSPDRRGWLLCGAGGLVRRPHRRAARARGARDRANPPDRVAGRARRWRRSRVQQHAHRDHRTDPATCWTGSRESPACRDLYLIQRSAQRAEPARELLAFGRRQLLQPRLIDLNDFVKELALATRVGSRIEATFDFEEPLRQIHADPGQLKRAILHLVGARVTRCPRAADSPSRRRMSTWTKPSSTRIPVRRRGPT